MVTDEAADLIARGKMTAWFQGNAEVGPRALGNRSILADPRLPGMKDISITRSSTASRSVLSLPRCSRRKRTNWFEHPHASPFMLLVLPIQARTPPGSAGGEPRRRHREAAERSLPRNNPLSTAG